jgi:hypothetical protein
MSDNRFPADAETATICTYFWMGIALGVLPFQRSKDWAFSMVEAVDAPPLGIIDIATANERNSALDVLGEESEGGDQQVAGCWLLADVLEQLCSKQISGLEAARLGRLIAQSACLSDTVYYDFDAFEDELQLALDGVFSTVESLELDLAAALRKHAGQGAAMPPPQDRT